MKNKLFATGLLIGLFFGLLPVAAQSTTTSIFSDVNTSTTYSEAIQYLKNDQVIQGYADGSYKPDQTINRAEFTKILMAAVNKNPTGENCFTDVQNQWYAPYICQAKSMGVVEGYADGSFKPAQEINFSEAAKIIANTYDLNKSGQDPAVWFKNYIEALQAIKAIPLSVEYFDEKITRDEMAEIIWRIKADVTDKSSRTYQELNGEGLVKVTSCADLEERYKELQPVYRGPMMYEDAIIKEALPGSTTAAPATVNSTTGGTGASNDYSTTNIQEQGVDEADIIKNDGQYIYLIKDNTIRIVEAYPASNLKELISFELGPKEENFYPSEMYVDGNQLTVIGSSNLYYIMDYGSPSPAATSIMPPRYNTSRTKVYIVDISDHSKPKVTRTVEFEGSYNTSRKIGSTLYMVMNNYPYYYPYPVPYYSTTTGTTTTTTTSTTTQTAPLFPDLLAKMKDSKDNLEVAVAPCTDIRIMPKPRSFNFLITAAIPLNDLSKAVSRSVLVGSSDNVYASLNNLYVADTDWSGPYYFMAGSANTKIYKFALNNGQIQFAAEGLVPGTVLNQFSMDERYGEFRLATTQQNSDGKSSNNLYVLDSSLKTIGKITGLAVGEKLYSARFMGDRAYLVTFKSIDPLFVVDLKDGYNPKVLGQLKIPGFSDYLHPYDANHIIGFGKDVDPAEAAKDQIYYTAVKGFKMALFDVTDPANPKEMFKEIIGDRGTYSDLLTNHKALLFDQDKGLLAFPITVSEMPEQPVICSNYNYSTCPSSCQKVCQPTCTYENGVTICNTDCNGANSCQVSSYVYPKTVFVGAYVYGLNLTSGFQLKAKITHLNADDIQSLLTNGYADYQKSIQRIIYIGDALYTVSQAAVKANSLSNPVTELKFIQLVETLYNLTYGKMLEPAVQ